MITSLWQLVHLEHVMYDKMYTCIYLRIFWRIITYNLNEGIVFLPTFHTTHLHITCLRDCVISGVFHADIWCCYHHINDVLRNLWAILWIEFEKLHIEAESAAAIVPWWNLINRIPNSSDPIVAGHHFNKIDLLI